MGILNLRLVCLSTKPHDFVPLFKTSWVSVQGGSVKNRGILCEDDWLGVIEYFILTNVVFKDFFAKGLFQTSLSSLFDVVFQQRLKKSDLRLAFNKGLLFEFSKRI